jgi:hypothetical protein
MALTNSQREALKLLADAADGCTVPFMVNHGCSVAALRHLARCRLAITDRVREPGTLRAPTVVRLRISDAGRKALARRDDRSGRVRFLNKWVLFVLFALGLLAGVCVGAFIPHV